MNESQNPKLAIFNPVYIFQRLSTWIQNAALHAIQAEKLIVN